MSIIATNTMPAINVFADEIIRNKSISIEEELIKNMTVENFKIKNYENFAKYNEVYRVSIKSITNNELYELNEKELFNYRQELIKTIGNSSNIDKISKLQKILEQTKKMLQTNEFIILNTEKLQKQIDLLTQELDIFISKELTINNRSFKINLYTQDLDIQKEKNLELIYTGEGGSDSDRALANKYLKIGQTYKVKDINVLAWHTDIILEDFPNIDFNSVLFTDKNNSNEYLEPYLEEYRKNNRRW